MSTQYNAVQGPYDEVRKNTIAILERVNVREKVLPFVKDANVLDLACGSGFYTYPLLAWGAKKVVGVDISAVMLTQARNEGEATGLSASVSFVEADCSREEAYPGGPFDLVVACWLLNYAASGKEMVNMFRNAALNLNDRGHFVAVMPPPTHDPAALIQAENNVRRRGTGGFFSTMTGSVEDGITLHRHADTVAGVLDFDCYHLRKEVYEVAAREGGFRGELSWSTTSVPDDFMELPDRYGESRNGGAEPEELQTYADVPFYGLLTLAK